MSLGAAEYVGAQWWEEKADPAPELPDADDQETGEPSQETEKATGHLDAEQLEEMDYNALKALAADMGVVPKGKKKADYIAASVAAEVEIGEEEDPDNDLPELSAADPE